MSGRPTKFNTALSAKMISLYEEGKTDSEVAEIIGISVRTIHYWKGSKPEFLHSLREAKGIADDFVEASLFQRAIGYDYEVEKIFFRKGKVIRVSIKKHMPADASAAIFWLRSRAPESWG